MNTPNLHLHLHLHLHLGLHLHLHLLPGLEVLPRLVALALEQGVAWQLDKMFAEVKLPRHLEV